MDQEKRYVVVQNIVEAQTRRESFWDNIPVLGPVFVTPLLNVVSRMEISRFELSVTVPEDSQVESVQFTPPAHTRGRVATQQFIYQA